MLQCLSGHPLLGLMHDNKKGLKVVETERGPIAAFPGLTLNGREKVVEKNGPFSLTFFQIVALMLPHRSVVTGLLFGSHLMSSFVEMKLALSQEEESQRAFQRGNTRQRP